MRLSARLALLVVVAAVAVGTLASLGGAATKPYRTSAYARIAPTAAGEDANGLAYFQQIGRRLSFWILVTGLEPNSTHAEHIHGPNGSCAPNRSAGIVVPLPDLQADANGVAWVSGSLSLAQSEVKRPLRRGFYVNVHQESTAGGVGAGITCGNLRVSPR